MAGSTQTRFHIAETIYANISVLLSNEPMSIVVRKKILFFLSVVKAGIYNVLRFCAGPCKMLRMHHTV